MDTTLLWSRLNTVADIAAWVLLFWNTMLFGFTFVAAVRYDMDKVAQARDHMRGVTRTFHWPPRRACYALLCGAWLWVTR